MSAERKTLEERAQMSDLERLRHSCAHVMATAILRLWPDAQFAYGPPVESGFYYDFDLKHRITPDDFEKIEAEMKKVAKENQRFDKKVITREEAIALAGSRSARGIPANSSWTSSRRFRKGRKSPASRMASSWTSARALM